MVKKIFLCFLFLVASPFSHAGSICIGSCFPSENPGSTLPGFTINPGDWEENPLYTISVEGSLFLDYSLFALDENNALTGNLSVTANEIQVFEYTNNYPYYSENFNYLNIAGEKNNFELNGDWMVFSTNYLADAKYIATEGIYIGNYSSISSVPLPSSFLLFLSSALLFCCPGKYKKILVKTANRVRTGF